MTSGTLLPLEGDFCLAGLAMSCACVMGNQGSERLEEGLSIAVQKAWTRALKWRAMSRPDSTLSALITSAPSRWTTATPLTRSTSRLTNKPDKGGDGDPRQDVGVVA